jgi:hypothetical protein
MQHDEFLRPAILLEGYVEKYKKKTTQFVRKWFKLDGNILSYSIRERLDVRFKQPRASVFIDKNFLFTKKDPNSLIIGVEFIDKKGKRKVWELKFSTMSDYVEWAKQLSIVKRPVWEPQTSTKCFECSRNFNFFRRQHHCRHCGHVVCGDHSESRFILEDLGYNEPVRVCDTCNKHLS